MSTAVYLIKIQVIEGAPFPFRWELYEQDANEPFLRSNKTFQTRKAAIRDAQFFLMKNDRQGIVVKE